MKWKTALLLNGLVVLSACAGDSGGGAPALPSEHGRWAVAEAMRNGRKTNTLDAAFFAFDTVEQVIETNFTGEPLKLDYVYEKDVISLRGSALLDSFIVNEATDSTLHLSTVIRGTPFFFKLRPDKEETEAGIGKIEEERSSEDE